MAGLTHLMAGRVEEALRLERRAVEIEPHSLQATYMLGLALAGASAWAEAIEWLSRAVDRSSRAPFYVGLLAWGQAASGRQELARQTLDELERRAATEEVSPLFRAWASSKLGDSEKTRMLLEEALAERASLLVLPGIPCLRQLRADLSWRIFAGGFSAREARARPDDGPHALPLPHHAVQTSPLPPAPNAESQITSVAYYK
jgi:tetratricopeptide (TPR) repeat protein